MKTWIFICAMAVAILGINPVASAYEWTTWTSEESGPRVCDNDKFVSGFGCSGSYCDNVRLECHNPSTVGNLAARNWLSQVSEEGVNSRFCPYNRYISGISTTGRYSDNINLECAYGSNQKKNSCYWTGWKSEESGGTLYFPSGYHATGMQCSGSFCDNKRFYICRSY